MCQPSYINFLGRRPWRQALLFFLFSGSPCRNHPAARASPQAASSSRAPSRFFLLHFPHSCIARRRRRPALPTPAEASSRLLRVFRTRSPPRFPLIFSFPSFLPAHSRTSTLSSAYRLFRFLFTFDLPPRDRENLSLLCARPSQVGCPATTSTSASARRARDRCHAAGCVLIVLPFPVQSPYHSPRPLI